MKSNKRPKSVSKTAVTKRLKHNPARAKKSISRRPASKKQTALQALQLSGHSQSWYGWHPDLPDHRDFLYSTIRPITTEPPPLVDLRPACSPVENQLTLGSCTANALVGAVEFLQLKRNPASFTDLSRLFLYYNERVLTHTTAQDSGGYLRDGIKCLRKQGICTEPRWPYLIQKFTSKPTPTCYREALDKQIISYHSVRGLNEFKACLAEGYPVVFGFTVYESFESSEVAHTGVLNYPVNGETPVGGHAVMAVGYHDTEQRLLARNSWGTDWGMAGYFTMPYDYAFGGSGRAALAADFWTIRSMK